MHQAPTPSTTLGVCVALGSAPVLCLAQDRWWAPPGPTPWPLSPAKGGAPARTRSFPADIRSPGLLQVSQPPLRQGRAACAEDLPALLCPGCTLPWRTAAVPAPLNPREGPHLAGWGPAKRW